MPDSPTPQAQVCFCRSGEMRQVDICTCECCWHDQTMIGNTHARCNYSDCWKCRPKP